MSDSSGGDVLFVLPVFGPVYRAQLIPVVGSLVRWLVVFLYAKFGWDFAEQRGGEVVAWASTGAVLLLSLLSSASADRRLVKTPPPGPGDPR